MKSYHADFILAKNELHSEDPIIVLFDVEIDDTTTHYWARYTQDVSWNGNTYNAAPIATEPISENDSGKVSDLKVSVSNVDRTVSAYVENYDLLGNEVTIHFVLASDLSITTNLPEYTYRINQIVVNAQSATFILGHENLYERQIPRQRYIRNKCRWVYKDSNCNYPSDDFEACTKQDLHIDNASADGERLFGWHVLNGDNCYACDTNTSLSDQLNITISIGTTGLWDDTAYAGTYVYKVLQGDFDVETYLVNTSINVNDYGCMFLVESATDADDWVAYKWWRSSGVSSLWTCNTTNGVTSDTDESKFWQYARIVRAGDTFTLYSKNASSDSWTQDDQFIRSDMSDPCQVGFAATNSGSGGVVAWGWDYFRANSGGLASCDYSLDGPNGCRMHKNTANYGGAPSIPYGRLYGI